MSARKLFYLGPQGTFTHQAAVNASQALAHLEPEGFELVAADDVPQILDAAQRGEDGASWHGKTTSKVTWCRIWTRSSTPKI